MLEKELTNPARGLLPPRSEYAIYYFEHGESYDDSYRGEMGRVKKPTSLLASCTVEYTIFLTQVGLAGKTAPPELL